MAAVLHAEFTPEGRELTDALTYSDMTTGSDGHYLTVEERLAEVRTRYGPGHIVDRSIERATPRIKTAARGRLHSYPTYGTPEFCR